MFFPTLDECIFGYKGSIIDVLACNMGCQNIWDLFHVCGENWRVGKEIIKNDFNLFVYNDIIPFYVKSYLYSELKMGVN